MSGKFDFVPTSTTTVAERRLLRPQLQTLWRLLSLSVICERTIRVTIRKAFLRNPTLAVIRAAAFGGLHVPLLSRPLNRMKRTLWDSSLYDDGTVNLPSRPSYDYDGVEASAVFSSYLVFTYLWGEQYDTQGAWATEGGYYDYLPFGATPLSFQKDTSSPQPARERPRREISHNYSSPAWHEPGPSNFQLRAQTSGPATASQRTANE